ncbi:hypothetical protein [Yoonia sp.]|uniref:hypothetical protein n=1 Tax=Yoonia sp. TaxID=2212373 RepID=UPI003A4DAC64
MYPYYSHDLEIFAYLADREALEREGQPDRTASVIALVVAIGWLALLWLAM